MSEILKTAVFFLLSGLFITTIFIGSAETARPAAAAAIKTRRLPQPQKDVSALFEAAPGITVSRLTDSPGYNQFSYYDINFYAPACDRFIYNTVVKLIKGPKGGSALKAKDERRATGKAKNPNKKKNKTPAGSENSADGDRDEEEEEDEKENSAGIGGGYPKEAVWGVASMKPDGTDNRLLLERIPPTTSTIRVDLSPDGKFVSYARMNDGPAAAAAEENGWDIYGFMVNDGVNVREIRLTRMNNPRGATSKVKTSPATYDPKTGKYVVAFSIEDQLYLVNHDGSSPLGGAAGPMRVNLTDLDEFPGRRGEKDVSFHRIRLNPVFPNIIYYRRNGVKDNWIIDWTQTKPRSTLFNRQTKAFHSVWTPDGTRLAGKERDPREASGVWREFTVVGRDGKVLPNAGYQTVQRREIRLSGIGDKKFPDIFYGSYSPDGSLLVVATDYRQEPGGSIWLIDTKTGKAKYLCKARYAGPVTQGQPRLGFFRGNAGIAFSTDNSFGLKESKPPQIYKIEGF